MNPVLFKYGITFIRKANGSKAISNTATSYVASYISEFDDIEIIDEYIKDVEMCLDGRYELINDPSRCSSIQYARLYPNGLYWDEKNFLALSDLKELLIAWRRFLANE